ncbi:aminoacylase-1-like [Photinus pyralis]|uniref:aminoacylase-1-like n=1 Tax=Photinus pyralis TaxID=7054 RepID=UPI0012677BCB|nr:aminoacylase-1-like [Photinus pyralis]
MTTSSKKLDAIAVENFREYLRIPSVHLDIDYEPCVTFLEKQAKEIGLKVSVFRDVPKNPMVVLTWMGKESDLPSIVLNSHMDVVPVFEEQWAHKPFGAEIDSEGNIYARGAQDCKCTGIQYLEAIRRLKLDGVEPRRTVHVTFMPDEELGGVNGAEQYVKTQNFKNLNTGCALDEAIGGENKTLIVFYGEKKRWSFRIHCPGQSGHGSLLLENTPGEKVRTVLNNVYDFRAEQKVTEAQDKRTDRITSINLSIIEIRQKSTLLSSKGRSKVLFPTTL